MIEPEKANPTEQAAARIVARKLITALDDRDPGRVWPLVSATIHQQLNEAEWVEKLSRVRAPTGGIRRRSWRQNALTTYTTDIPGAPPGRYFLFEYRTGFNALLAIERVVIVAEGNDWRIAAYSVRPVSSAD